MEDTIASLKHEMRQKERVWAAEKCGYEDRVRELETKLAQSEREKHEMKARHTNRPDSVGKDGNIDAARSQTGEGD